MQCFTAKLPQHFRMINHFVGPAPTPAAFPAEKCHLNDPLPTDSLADNIISTLKCWRNKS
jgi:hypothetical protein